MDLHEISRRSFLKMTAAASVAAGLSAVLVNFACHLDVLGNGNFLIAADYPYYLRETLQAAYGKSLVIPFANGPCGNINHINVFANRRQGGYDLARMMGMMLAGEVLKIEPTATPLTVTALSGRSQMLDLPRRPYSEAELAEFRATLADDRIAETAYPKVRARTHLALHRGRMVVELRPPVSFGKGRAVEGQLRLHGGERALYMGDDLTDVDAFRALRRLEGDIEGFSSLCVAVASPESPGELLMECDLAVTGVDGAVDLLTRL